MQYAKAMERAAENEQLQQQQGQDSPGTRHNAREIRRQDAHGNGDKGSKVEEGGEADVLQRVIEAPPTKVCHKHLQGMDLAHPVHHMLLWRLH